jgi:predicted cupin superfamily sugar epimerase
MTPALTADEVITQLALRAHPEGGWFRETFRDAQLTAGRAASTAIYYLLAEGQRSHWHRVMDAPEVWHFHAGAALELRVAPFAGGPAEIIALGAALKAGQQPQAVVRAGDWQSARSLGAWTLVGCTVAPGFDFSAFEMAPEGWEPGA